MDEQVAPTTTVENVDVQISNTQQYDFYDENADNTMLSNEGQLEGTGEQPEASPETPEAGSEASQTESAETTEQLTEQIAKNNSTIKAVNKDLKAKGVDFNAVIKEYEEFGGLSGETMANLGKAGYPKEVIQTFIDSRNMLAEKFTQAVYQRAGGEQEFKRITQWAGQNLPESTVTAFNKAIDSDNLEMIGLMIDGMKSRMVAKHGTRNPSVIGSGASPTADNKGFESKDAMIKAMSDPRYGKDSAYMREIEQKMLHTRF
jgi:uncharacterized protein YbaA (DUF1428 family)